MIREIDETLVTAKDEVKEVEIRVNSDLYQINELLQTGENTKVQINRNADHQPFEKRNTVEKESQHLDQLKSKIITAERTLKAQIGDSQELA
jgi:hypothetical protein